MPIEYRDKELNKTGALHPAVSVNTNSPYYKMIRYGKDGESIFKWTRQEALVMYEWYINQYKPSEIVDEFGNIIFQTEWSQIIRDSHYELGDGSSSDNTIAEEWAEECAEERGLNYYPDAT